MKRINIDFKVEKNGKLVKVQSEESVPTKTSELENDSGFITQAPETVIDNQTITKIAQIIQIIKTKPKIKIHKYQLFHLVKSKWNSPNRPKTQIDIIKFNIKDININLFIKYLIIH